MNKRKTILRLFLTMLKIGLFTFGGGYAMLALIENEFVTKRKWLTREEFLDMVAISESTPGPIAINSATYVGYKVAGVLGSLVATLGVVIPSFVIIYAISLVFDAFLSFTAVEYAFRGIQVSVIYLILSSGLKLLKGIKKTPFNLAIIISVVTITVFFSLFAINLSSVVIILLSGVVGLIPFILKRIKERRVE